MEIIEAQTVKQVERHQQIEHEDGEVGQDAAGQRRREEPVAEHRKLDQGRGSVAFPLDEADREPDAGDQ